jgi:ABC-type uncharacterized transport system involved in gliding motility auxiliary subunit
MQRKSFQTILYSAAGIAVMGLILVAINFMADPVRVRIDLTREKAYTLSSGTKAILHKLDAPVKIRFYFTQSENASPESVYLRDYARRVEDLLAEYKGIAGDKLIVEKYDPQPDSNAEDSAKLDGLEAKALSNGEEVYLGLAVSVLDEKQAIPFLDPTRERLLEYDLSRAIARVTTPERSVVGVMSPLPLFGMPANPMMAQMGQSGQEPWAIITELKNDYTVKRVDMDTDKIDDDVNVLLVVHPRNISNKAQFAIDQFIMRGGRLIAFLDPLPLVDSQQQQNPMLGNMGNRGSTLDKLLKAWGLQFDAGKVVADMNFKVRLGGRGDQTTEAPAFLSVTSEGINGDDIVTSEIDNIWLPFVGAFTGTPAPGLRETVLLKSTPDSQLVEGLLAQLSGDTIIKEFKPSGTNYALALRLDGSFKTAFPQGEPRDEKKIADTTDKQSPAEKANVWMKETRTNNTVVLVGDADLLNDQFALQTVQTIFGNFAKPVNGNLTFAENAVEQLSGDNNLIAVRSRATQNRPFTRITKMQTQADEAYQSKVKELETSLAETRQSLNELQRAKQGNQRFILSPEQEAEIEKFRKKEAEVNIQLKEERKQLRHDIDSLEDRVKWLNLAAIPALVSLSGLGLALYQRRRASPK